MQVRGILPLEGGDAVLVRRRWPELGLIGMANLIAQVLTYGVIAGLLAPLLLRGPLGVPRHYGGARELLALTTGAAGRAGLVVAPVALAALAFMLAGLVGSLARLRHDEPVGFWAYWDEGARGFSRAFGVVLLWAVGSVLVLWLFIGAQGPWGALVWGLLSLPGLVYGLLYPVYLGVVGGLGVRAAYERSLGALVGDLVTGVQVSVVVLGFGVGYSLLMAALLRGGFLGQVGIGFGELLGLPWLVLYLVERLEGAA